MPRLFLIAALTLSALSTAPAEAKDKACPPGLAKKAIPCVPPGQVGKSWDRGDRVEGDYVLIPREEWERLALHDFEDNSTYLQIDNQILRVMRDTMTVIEAIRIVDRVLN